MRRRGTRHWTERSKTSTARGPLLSVKSHKKTLSAGMGEWKRDCARATAVSLRTTGAPRAGTALGVRACTAATACRLRGRRVAVVVGRRPFCLLYAVCRRAVRSVPQRDGSARPSFSDNPRTHTHTRLILSQLARTHTRIYAFGPWFERTLTHAHTNTRTRLRYVRRTISCARCCWWNRISPQLYTHTRRYNNSIKRYKDTIRFMYCIKF